MKHIIEQMKDSYGYASVVRSEGPVRVDTSEENKEFKRRPVGFTANLEEEIDES